MKDIKILEQKVKELTKGQQKLMKKRSKWKNRYYKIKYRNQQAIKWIKNAMNNSNIKGCNLEDLQLLLDILKN